MITYAGLDVITTYYNWKFLEKILPLAYDKAKQNYEFLHRGHQLFANMSHRGVKAGIDELDELESTFEDNIQDILERISILPEFVEYNDYLGNRLTTKKQGDKKLKKLMIKVKGDSNESNRKTMEKSTIKIRRKIQF